MCYQTFAALLRNEGIDWLEDIDLIVWDQFDDFRSYYKKEVESLKRLLPNFSEEKLIALLQQGKTTSVVNFIYQLKTIILEPARIRLIAISATPEFAAAYFSEYLNYIYCGKMECANDAKAIYFIKDVISALQNGTFTPVKGQRYWCYTKYIHEALAIQAMARAKGFKTIALWSQNNAPHRTEYTAEKQRITKIIQNEHYVPAEYNFIITTGVLGRGVDVFDTTIQDWICNSAEYEEIVQSNRARFSPNNQYLLEKARGLVEFVQNGFAAQYYQWHSLDELRVMIQKYPIFRKNDSSTKITTFAAVRKEYPELFEMRKYGKSRITQYRMKPKEEKPA